MQMMFMTLGGSGKPKLAAGVGFFDAAERSKALLVIGITPSTS
jgi:hypothetical protein